MSSTIRHGIIDNSFFDLNPGLLVLGMIATLLAAAVWLMIACNLGWPVSTTNTTVGAIVGFALVAAGPHAVEWLKLGGIIGSWVLTPMLSALLAYLLFISVQKLIFDTDSPLDNAKRYVPVYVFLTSLVVCLVTFEKGLLSMGIIFTEGQSWLWSLVISVVISVGCAIYISRQRYNSADDAKMHYTNVERVFGVLMVITACSMGFAHGANDLANAIGPISAIMDAMAKAGHGPLMQAGSGWILPLSGIGIILGLLTFGHKIMRTVGEGITHLTPSRGFAAQLATSATVIIASGAGLPVSATQALVASVLGVGLARGIAAINLGVVRNIAVCWLVTIPAGGVLAIVFFMLLKAIFM